MLAAGPGAGALAVALDEMLAGMGEVATELVGVMMTVELAEEVALAVELLPPLVPGMVGVMRPVLGLTEEEAGIGDGVTVGVGTTIMGTLGAGTIEVVPWLQLAIDGSWKNRFADA